VLALLELKPPRLKFKVGADEAVVVVAAPPVAAALEVVDMRG